MKKIRQKFVRPFRCIRQICLKTKQPFFINSQQKFLFFLKSIEGNSANKCKQPKSKHTNYVINRVHNLQKKRKDQTDIFHFENNYNLL